MSQKNTQWGETGCGQASATMVLQYFFGPSYTSLANVEAALDSSQFAFIGDIPGALRTLSQNRLTAVNKAAPDGNTARATILTALAASEPLIALLPAPGYLPGFKKAALPHYVVIYGYNRANDKVAIDDPYFGKRDVNWSDFDLAWSSVPSVGNYVTIPYQYVLASRTQ